MQPHELEMAALMSRFAASAYSTFETDSGTALKGEISAAGFDLVQTFDWEVPPEAMSRRERRDRGIQAYIAGNDTMLVVAFRGTTDNADWATNLQSGKRIATTPQGRKVPLHAGFWLAYSQIAVPLERAIAVELDRKSRPLVFTGHSLGGALAQIAAAVSGRPENSACYTFGAPRVAASWFRRVLQVPHYRFVNGWDVVPIVPPALLGYGHTGPCWHLKRDPPATSLSRGRSGLRTIWINLRGLVGIVFGREWAGTRDHAIGAYGARIAAVAGGGGSAVASGRRQPAASP